jgi:hypothetical protein
MANAERSVSGHTASVTVNKIVSDGASLPEKVGGVVVPEKVGRAGDMHTKELA